MANWSEKFNKMTQSAVNKSKELVEITKLNLNISNAEEEIKKCMQEIGEYVVKENLLADHEEIKELLEKINNYKNSIQIDKEKVLELRAVNICSECGAEVPRTSKFCNKCGASMPSEKEENLSKERICPQCGAVLDEDTVFCGECGAKCEE